MIQTSANPTVNLHYRKQRRVTRSVTTRNIRVDAETDHALASLRQTLRGETPEDAVTFSMSGPRVLESSLGDDGQEPRCLEV